MKIDNIKNVIVQDEWSYKTKSGESVTSKILVGRPFRIPDDKNRDWICPVWIEHFTPGIVQAFGVGPVNSLMNAMTLVRAFFDKRKKAFTEDFNRTGEIKKKPTIAHTLRRVPRRK